MFQQNFIQSRFWIFVLYVTFTLSFCIALDPPNHNLTRNKAHILPPCQACKSLVESFKKGMERTSRGKFEGGDADWEEKKLRSYANSEVRLVEIQEKLCSDLSKGEDQCHNLAEAHESLIEDWFLNHQKLHGDLHHWLCIKKLKVCCPDHHYGPECLPCPGSSPEMECSSNGKCKGSGTRKGNGKCVCDAGYSGELCQQCASGFYDSYRDDKKVLCSACHRSCKDVCTQAGPKGCLTCNDGWFMDTEQGCSDIDECLTNKTACNDNSFCVNSPGSHTCINCDKACKGCVADGPDNCVECAENYELKEGVCKGPKSWSQSWQGSSLRYLTYLGMCLSTCIIFQSSTTLAALVGVCVAAYISLSEYSINTEDPNSANPLNGAQIVQ
ncbi:cysteine-rich with EGF-like domain protein 2 isoform X1 [Daphnia pulex]|uniref:cysteine-rich with EGF-like domain protein 2 isoform X1 n=1 Tax=Daphnia pulex TaxID=6669 RepID=UPI001EDF3B4C|nr:cysteine-rich with EGF-like domain protein 2 isoform X1 [Daphnia pulex]